MWLMIRADERLGGPVGVGHSGEVTGLENVVDGVLGGGVVSLALVAISWAIMRGPAMLSGDCPARFDGETLRESSAISSSL